MTEDDFAAAYLTGRKQTERFLRSRGIRWSEAEDIADEAWIQGLETRSQLRDPSRVIPWVNKIAIHIFIDRSRQKRRMDQLLTAYERSSGSSGSVLTQIQVQAALNACNPRQRGLLIGRHFDGYSIRELAKHSGKSEGAVESELHRARRVFLQRLNGTEGRA
jgi:RNA polymerase sigma-70 factor (ECF subfamily)